MPRMLVSVSSLFALMSIRFFKSPILAFYFNISPISSTVVGARGSAMSGSTTLDDFTGGDLFLALLTLIFLGGEVSNLSSE